MSFYHKTVLPSGLRVVTEEIPHVRSASVGIWVGAGSGWEDAPTQGVSHFIEHLLFKGTKKRSARQIAQAIEGRGGHLNAFTSKEHTCYYARMLDKDVGVATDVLADMLTGSLFDPDEIVKEKGVVVEEIKMYEDVPDDLVHDLFARALWGAHPLGRPVVGTAETVQGLERTEILNFMGTHYTPDNMVVAVAGNIEHEAVVAAVSREFASLAGKGGGHGFPDAPPDPAEPLALVRRKETEQVHLVLGMRGLYHDHEDAYAMQLMNAVLGGGASSRLFQEIRENRGLAYSVYSYPWTLRNVGAFGVYAGTSLEHMDQVLQLVQEELRQMGREGISATELQEAKDQLKGQIMLSLESTSTRMSRLGRGELARGQVYSPDEILARIDRVTTEQVQRLTEWLFLEAPRVLSVVGPIADGVDLSAFGFSSATFV